MTKRVGGALCSPDIGVRMAKKKKKKTMFEAVIKALKKPLKIK
tara:strand:- start:396 stop:524 length:129 start_codon:yes stop_codon:yes gene_type:complete